MARGFTFFPFAKHAQQTLATEPPPPTTHGRIDRDSPAMNAGCRPPQRDAITPTRRSSGNSTKLSPPDIFFYRTLRIRAQTPGSTGETLQNKIRCSVPAIDCIFGVKGATTSSAGLSVQQGSFEVDGKSSTTIRRVFGAVIGTTIPASTVECAHLRSFARQSVIPLESPQTYMTAIHDTC